MNRNTRVEKPFDFLITNLPDDFAEARLQDQVIMFDNLNREFPYPSKNGRYEFPVKCGSYIIMTIRQGCLKLKVNLQGLEGHGESRAAGEHDRHWRRISLRGRGGIAHLETKRAAGQCLCHR